MNNIVENTTQMINFAFAENHKLKDVTLSMEIMEREVRKQIAMLDQVLKFRPKSPMGSAIWCTTIDHLLEHGLGAVGMSIKMHPYIVHLSAIDNNVDDITRIATQMAGVISGQIQLEGYQVRPWWMPRSRFKSLASKIDKLIANPDSITPVSFKTE